MGNWMMLISTGAVISGYLSKILLSDYTLSFSVLGGTAVIIGISTFVLLPLILSNLE